MKLKKILVYGAILAVVYKIGNIRGHMSCLDNLAKKYGDDIFDDNGELVDTIYKGVNLIRVKGAKATKGE